MPWPWQAGGTREAAPIGRIAVFAVGMVTIVIYLGTLAPPRIPAAYPVESSHPAVTVGRGLMDGAGPVTAQRLLDDMTRAR